MDTRNRHRRARWALPLAAVSAVICLLAASLMLVAGPATAARTVLTFRHVDVDVHQVSITYTINRRPSHITGRTCFLNNGTTRVQVKCGPLPSTNTLPTRVTVGLRGLAYGDYTYTVRAMHIRSLLAKATTAFNVGGVLDQSNIAAASVGGVAPTCVDVAGADRAQTFTAGTDGQLRAVSVVVVKQGDPPPLVVNITGLSAGVPDSTILGTGTYTGSGSADWNTFFSVPLTSEVALTAGQQYAMVLTSPDPDGVCTADDLWGAVGSAGDTYVGGIEEYLFPGDPWAASGDDLAFKTWLTP